MTASRSSRRTAQAFQERRGAHRPPGLGVVAAVPWVVAAAVVVVVVLIGGGLRHHSQKPSGAAPVSSGTPRPTVSRTSTAALAPATASTATSEVRRDLALVVLNGTARSGLAARAAEKLRRAGWQVRSTGNHPSVGGTVVYYGRPSLQATAEGVVQQLGGGRAQESADFGAERVTVVLGADVIL